MSDELKPCPFCGAEVVRCDPPYVVQHPDAECFLAGECFFAEQWNRRHLCDREGLRRFVTAAVVDALYSEPAGVDGEEVERVDAILAAVEERL